MRSLTPWLICAALVASAAQAESFNRRLARGQALLKTGDVDEAITIFRDLQVDEPESEVLQFDLGCAHYAKALDAAEDSALPEAAEALQRAVESFEEASMTSNGTLRRDAQFNRATTLAQMAKQSVSGENPQATIAAFEQAITGLEDFLRQYPDHADARTNLNNVRYELKKFLQQAQPPEGEQSSEDSEGDGEESEQQQDDPQQQQGENDEQGEPQEQQQQQRPSEQEQEQQEQQETPQQEEGESPEEQEQPSGEAAEDAQSESSESQQIAESNENIEAILDSLQDTDEQQQHEMRQHSRPSGIRSKWW